MLEIVIHGHFYQPPRENPWTGLIDAEPSAAPFENWNARIDAEAYRPNAFARIVDDRGWVVAIVNNYENLSFNMGPTLLSWMETHDPQTYARVLDGDRKGGGAVAQAFGHIILPLATDEDIRRQVRWGLADFRYRFGREAAGMWLPECAVNDNVLRILAEEGVKFTILAPTQIASVEGGGDFDISKPLLWVDPDDESKSVALVVYDGNLSHAVAFEMGTLSSQTLIDRMRDADAGRNGLVTLSTDGETFGHHHRFGERLIGYALAFEAPRRGIVHTNFNRAVADIEPTQRVQVWESAWSCAHGVERWRSDCGCETGGAPGWNQKWRTPLRDSLNWLRGEVSAVWNEEAPATFANADFALDDYVNVIIGAKSREEYKADHGISNPSRAFALLEMQQDAMSMFTSCGWFFNDLSGIETVQILRYAARVLDFMDELGASSRKDEFLGRLADARSNIEAEGSGLDIWMRHVETARPTSSATHIDAPHTMVQKLEALAVEAVVNAARDQSPEAVELALKALDVAMHMGVNLNLDRAQEAVYFALLEGHRENLKPLANVLKVVA